ncbi:hypothetical protein [uncultured Desulfovibrio sp.]|uniref:hypothetical protein n=1 Tax=uncultured Desulfovibrio sp. TaxID=167968 RepID=UPI0026DAD3AC|nr:hypothetical protein [uncultured Desulfovibrio sp.]
MMKSFILALIGVLVIGGAFAVQHMRLQRAEASAALLEKDLAAARKEAAAWKLTADQARAGQTALAGQAQACLDREAAAQADADQWRAVMDAMQIREMSDAEKTGVPDDETRRALLADLDRPL